MNKIHLKKINKKTIIGILKKNKNYLNNNFDVVNIGLFGSYAKEYNKDTSDIDILVEFKNESETFDKYMDLKFYLEDILKKKVDLVIKNSVKEIIKSKIYQETIYAWQRN